MKRLRRQPPFLESILNQSNRFKREELLERRSVECRQRNDLDSSAEQNSRQTVITR